MADILILPIDTISVSGGTQSRVALNEATVAEYAEVIRMGGELPPVIVFNDGASEGMWLADGFHRFHAHRAAGAMEINCDVRVGTRRDAILHSVGANATHGLRRTNEDKRGAVSTLLSDPEWSAWSNEAVARACHVSPHTVAAVRSGISANAEIPAAGGGILNPLQDAVPIRVVERNGVTYEQNTANIGKAAPKTSPTPAAPPAEIGPKLDASREEAPEPAQAAASADAEREPVPASEADLLRDQVAELSENLRTTLADNEMMGRVFDADDQVKASMLEASRQKAIAENAERTLMAKNGEYVERARAVTHWKNRAERAEKELARLKP